MTGVDPKTAGRVPTTGYIPTDAEIRQIDDWFADIIEGLKADTRGTSANLGIHCLDTTIAILSGQLRDCRERVDVVGMAVAWGDLTRAARQMQMLPGFQDLWLDRPDGTL